MNYKTIRKSLILILLLMAVLQPITAQEAEQSISYRPTAEKRINVKHTRLEASFDYSKSQLLGKVTLTLSPHFYSTDSVWLDAKGMDIHRVSAKEQTLSYAYNGRVLRIKLDRVYNAREEFTVIVQYTAKPNDLEVAGSAAINDARGLYFINPLGKDKNKPTQIWTQGETEATSVWCPIIDRPNQKTTSEMILRVPAKYVSLSNGKLVSQQNNADDTRTDHWKMELPHSPYLFFIGIGDYAVVKDSYKQMEVNYYVEKEYAPVAKKIFGYTPEMIGLYERLTGVPYPWNKYSQMTARDYVSGAMENTTATLHGSSSQQDARQLVDENAWESVISHELFHQWFGNYVTAESWSNLPLNESFATYGEFLWDEYKHGAEWAHNSLYRDHEMYLNDSSAYGKNLVRFYYAEQEDMFDNVSYQKGGAILHLLRTVVGDSAFFKALNLYLVSNKFGNVEAHQLRLAMEQVSGMDLNWFFDQWFFNHGHPVVSIRYDYSKNNQVTVNITQHQPYLFRIPLQIDVYEGEKRTTYPVVADTREKSFTFPIVNRPDLVNVDADKTMLWQKNDEKTLDNYVFQYAHGNYVDRLEAIHAAIMSAQDPKSQQLLKLAIKDKSEFLRTRALTYLSHLPAPMKKAITPDVIAAVNDKRPLVQAAAIDFLSSLEDPQYGDVLRQHLNDSSYSVSGSALMGLLSIAPDEATAFAVKQKTTAAKGTLADVINQALMTTKSPAHFEHILNYLHSLQWYETAGAAMDFSEYLEVLKDDKLVMRGVDLLAATSKSIPAAYKTMFEPTLLFAIQQLADKKKESGKTRVAAEIQKRISGK